MAQILVDYDTVSKMMKITQDGKKVNDVHSIVFSSKYDKPGEFYMEMASMTHDEENDIHKMYRVMCEKYQKDEVVKKIEEYFNKKYNKNSN